MPPPFLLLPWAEAMVGTTDSNRATAARFNLLHTLPGFFLGVVAKAFPYGSSCGSNDRFLAEHRNLLRYNMADIETATPELRLLPHVRQPGGRRLIDSPVIRHLRQARASAVKEEKEGYDG